MSSPAMTRDATRSFKLLKYSTWDWVPIGLGLLHFAYLAGIFVAFSYMLWPLRIAAALCDRHLLEHQQRLAQFHS